MIKHSFQLLVAAATMTLAGCQLYFGEDHDDDNWTYCGQDGYYECNDEDCYWRGPECPAGTDPSTTPPGQFECTEDEDCAAGCYCGNGVCEEAGFCTNDSDCGPGYTCDEQRASCEPDGEQPGTSCGADNDCPTGQYCNSDTLKCEATCICATDAEAASQGFAYCDESRNTCLPGEDPIGQCAGDVTCGTARPACPEGQVALISNGCYTGQCQAINACAAEPSCSSYGWGSDCTAAGCSASYTGINCRAADGVTPCDVPSATCTCQSYTFASCSEGSMPRVVVVNGLEFEIPSELVLQ